MDLAAESHHDVVLAVGSDVGVDHQDQGDDHAVHPDMQGVRDVLEAHEDLKVLMVDLEAHDVDQEARLSSRCRLHQHLTSMERLQALLKQQKFKLQ